MTSSFWDPENLLQITDDLRSRSGEISCLGITKHGARCRWDVLEPNLSEVRPLLRDMSKVKPESITIETLRRLARLCLCPKFHSHQAEQVVRHWRTVLETATLHHKTLLENNNSPSSDTAQTIESRLAFKEEECEDLKKTLDREMVSNARLRDEWMDKSSEMTTEITHLKQELDEHQHHIMTAVQAMLDQKKTAQTLIEQRKEESINRDRAEKDSIILQGKLKANQDKLKRVREENENLVKEVATAVESNKVEMQSRQNEIDQLKAKEQDLVKERDAGDAMLQQYRAQAGKQLAQNTLLNDQVASLEAAQARLEASIASCWVHGFWGWASRFKGGRNRSTHLGGQKERVEEIALKTYA